MYGHFACKTRSFFMVKGTVGLLAVNRDTARMGAEITLELADSIRNTNGTPALPVKVYKAWHERNDQPDFTHHYTAAAIARERLSMLNEVLEDVVGMDN
jgi:hypothetical protein